MVEWTDAERKAIKSVWGKINVDVIGPQVLARWVCPICWMCAMCLPAVHLHVFLLRCLIVYPWTQRYFGSFGSLSDVASIMGNKKVAAHGKVVLNGLRLAVQNMDDIKNTYAPLSVLHSEKLHVDPDNFRVGLCFWIWMLVRDEAGLNNSHGLSFEFRIRPRVCLELYSTIQLPLMHYTCNRQCLHSA